MDLENIIQSGINQKDEHHIIFIYVWNLKYDTNELIYKTERLTDTENKLVITKRENDKGRIN